ncbi:hypothetical protein SAZ11_61430 [Streptomyces sp. FXJ1.4098]|nr:hypothetical protein [Streptomyces sp. FXJ1.4098]
MGTGSAERQGDSEAAKRLDTVLVTLVTACRVLADELRPFIPDAATRITAQLTPVEGVCPQHSRCSPDFRRTRGRCDLRCSIGPVGCSA